MDKYPLNITESGDFEKLNEIIAFLRKEHRIEVKEIIDDFDEIYIDLDWGNKYITLDCSAFDGINLYPTPDTNTSDQIKYSDLQSLATDIIKHVMS